MELLGLLRDVDFAFGADIRNWLGRHHPRDAGKRGKLVELLREAGLKKAEEVLGGLGISNDGRIGVEGSKNKYRTIVYSRGGNLSLDSLKMAYRNDKVFDPEGAEPCPLFEALVPSSDRVRLNGYPSERQGH